MPAIPWDEWSSGQHGEILVCATCCDRKHRGRRTTLRSGDIPVYKTEAGAERHVDRFPRHRLEGVLELRRRYLERPETIWQADRSRGSTVTGRAALEGGSLGPTRDQRGADRSGFERSRQGLEQLQESGSSGFPPPRAERARGL